MTDVTEHEPLLKTAEVAAMLHVGSRTVLRWANEGKLTSLRTPGGDRRFLASEVRALDDAVLTPAEASAVLGIPVKKLLRLEARGKLTAGRTLGGHRRYRAVSVEELRGQMESAGAS